MSRTARLNLSLEPANTARAHIVFDELVQWIEAGYTEIIKTQLDTGKTLTIPEGYQMHIFNHYDMEGDLIVEGTLVIL